MSCVESGDIDLRLRLLILILLLDGEMLKFVLQSLRLLILILILDGTPQAALVKDPGVSINRVIWSPDGALFGVAYSRHIVQIYSYHGGDEVRQHLEI
ncbi:protein TPR3-like isoform X2 [Arachis hypogaea]|uniref:protein TPR3-like isoform X2 n=1 Tax=Arachis hypogaea TaxID=3818 RepID=UPI000DED2D58|nr:protein TPR3 [Arachis hypogaea]